MLFNWDSYAPEAPAETFWDAIVVGAGMGGSTLGYALARKGMKVLFVERGAAQMHFPASLQEGRWKRVLGLERHEDRLSAMGRWSKPLTIMRKGQPLHFMAPMGSGPGGSSAIYGAGLERMRRVDFAASDHQGPDAERVTDEWPVSYDEFRPYYSAAEALFNVAGTPDPDDPDDDTSLAAPPALSARDRHFFESFESVGMKPYRVHVGIGYRDKCRECIGLPCPTDCKADGSSKALWPAVVQYGAKVLLNCEVQHLEASNGRVTAVIAKSPAGMVKLRGLVVVLAAGALATPVLLRKSESDESPNGLGNHNDIVGRCLMFHASDLIALWPRKNADSRGPQKTLSSRAFYSINGRKFGSFQSLGLPVSQGVIYDFLMSRLERFSSRKIPLASLGVRFTSIVAAAYFNRACVFATILEDFPYLNNRVVADSSRPSGFQIEYVKSPELSERIATMRSMIKSSLAAHKPWILTGDDNLNMGHPSGTCRFGTNPSTSVLDPNNKVWGVKNLYVADASFFPSSGGANPALTVAANALRLADPIACEAGRA